MFVARLEVRLSVSLKPVDAKRRLRSSSPGRAQGRCSRALRAVDQNTGRNHFPDLVPSSGELARSWRCSSTWTIVISGSSWG